MMAEQPVVELKNISKHFGEGATRVDALRAVSFEVFPEPSLACADRADPEKARC
jgi:putative ABC transport system ATP-binding protein